MMLTGTQLERLLFYDPETGVWTWTHHHSVSPRHRGQVAGHVRADGYRRIRIGGVPYYTGRLAFLWMKGYWPEEVDHADRDPSNDKWSNLREANSSLNKFNRDYGDMRGVYASGNKWWAMVGRAGYLGTFNTLEEASAARDVAAFAIAGPFAILNSLGKST